MGTYALHRFIKWANNQKSMEITELGQGLQTDVGEHPTGGAGAPVSDPQPETKAVETSEMFWTWKYTRDEVVSSPDQGKDSASLAEGPALMPMEGTGRAARYAGAYTAQSQRGHRHVHRGATQPRCPTYSQEEDGGSSWPCKVEEASRKRVWQPGFPLPMAVKGKGPQM